MITAVSRLPVTPVPPPGLREVPAAHRGPLLFTRFAYPPNALGHCGPGDSAALLEYASSSTVDNGLRSLARGFEGAWPYLELIAGANGYSDPLDVRVVEAYWLGNRLLDGVAPFDLGTSVDDRFRRRTGSGFSEIADRVAGGSLPHHNFHVFTVYPWLGLLRGGRVDQPLEVLDRCRIRWGRVRAVSADMATVSFRPLRWTGTSLVLGPPELETVRWRHDGLRLTAEPNPGDWVALHWDWVCSVLTQAQLGRLRWHTHRELEAANRGAVPTAAGVLG